LGWNLIIGHRAERGRYPKVFIVNKILLVPLAYLMWTQLTKDFSPYITGFAILSWAGDVLLFFKDIFLKAFGALSFGLCHLAIIKYFDIHWALVPWTAYIKYIPLLIGFLVLLVSKFDFTKVKSYGAILYTSFLHIAVLSSAVRSYIYPLTHPSFLLCFIGYAFFLVSDSFLFSNELEIDLKPRRYEIMLTYAVAQGLIFTGVALSV